MKTKEIEWDSLARLAAAHGIQLSYADIWGNVHEVPPERLKEMLAAIGVDLRHPEEHVNRLEQRSWRELAEPVMVEQVDSLPTEFTLQIPGHCNLSDRLNRKPQVVLEVIGEDDPTATYSYEPEQLLLKESREVYGGTRECWSVPFPQKLSIGYYQFRISVVCNSEVIRQTISVIICPVQTYLPPELKGKGKKAGLAISLYSLRSRRNWGIGDFGDLKAFVRWAIESLHVDVIGLNPLHAISNKEPYNISPYYPSSRFYRNFVYLDVEAIEDYRLCGAAKELVRTETTQNLLDGLRTSTLVQYERVAKMKLQVLQMVFQTFLQNHWKDGLQETNRGQEFKTYMAREGAMLDVFATFCTIEAFFNKGNPHVRGWQRWPKPFQNPQSQEVHEFRQSHSESILFYKYLQWQLECQLQEAQDLASELGACVGLYHDLALGVDPGGADAWAYQDFFVQGVTVGAPPDDFALDGQDWGFNPPSGEYHRNEGYRLFVQEIRKNCQAGGALRIDHVMRFFRLFWITAGRPAKEGTYVENHCRELLLILALESQRAKTLIIGEDLGTVPTYVRERLQELGMFSYRLFYFERDDHSGFKSADAYPPYALAAVGTHDLPTLAGFWTAQDLFLRNKLGMFPSEKHFEVALHKRKEEKELILERLIASGFLGDEDTSGSKIYAELTANVRDAIIRFLLSTEAKLVVFSQEDLFMDVRQQNLPGTVSEHPNWSTKMSYTIEELYQDGMVKDCARHFRSWIYRSGRSVLASL